jgi:hypothetical protein
MLDICLCSYNPRREILRKVISSLAKQECDHSQVRFILVDNNSSPPISDSELVPTLTSGIASILAVEKRSGIFHARNRAMRESTAEMILWVDDDTEFPPDYISTCLAIARDNPAIGCFGGRLVAGPSCKYPRWCESFLPYLAIIDRGSDVISGMANHWGPWEPPTAGAIVRRPVIDQYLSFIQTIPHEAAIGQIGSAQLLRGEDSLIMRMACRLGLQCSYQPRLYAIHHVDNRRFGFRYLLRLFHGYGRSFVILERLLGNSIPAIAPRDSWTFFWQTKRRAECANWQMFVAMKFWNLGFIYESNSGRYFP